MSDSERGLRVLVVLEGRDGAGKTTTARDLVDALGSDVCDVVALGRATDVELRGAAYFERWRAHLPEPGHVVVLDRSWYNRAVVERVMDFVTAAEVEVFFEHVPRFEADLVARSVRLVKVFITIGEREQARRLEDRRATGRLSVVDAAALSHAEAYARAEQEMIARTSTPSAPWIVVPECERDVRLALLLDHIGRARAGAAA